MLQLQQNALPLCAQTQTLPHKAMHLLRLCFISFFHLFGRFPPLLASNVVPRQTLENRHHPFWPVCSPVTRPITSLRTISCSEHGCHAYSGARAKGPRSQHQVEWPRPLGPPLLLLHCSECLLDLAGTLAVAAWAPRGSKGPKAVPLRHPTPACTLSCKQRTACCSTALQTPCMSVWICLRQQQQQQPACEGSHTQQHTIHASLLPPRTHA